MVTIGDIAKKVGMTQATVSRVLTGKGTAARISEQTQQKIRQVADQLHYFPSFAGRALVRGKTFSLGFLCGNIRNPHYIEMADLAMQEAEKRGYHLVLGITEWQNWDNDLQCFDTLMSRGIDGMIFFGNALQPNTAQYRQVVQEKFPLVSINYQIPDLPSLCSDWQPGVDQTFAHLKALGYSNVISCGLEQSEKQTAVEIAAQTYGIRVESYIINSPCPQALVELRDLGRSLANRPDRPQAIIVTSDYLAMRFMCGLTEGGASIPADISVIGMDGTDEGEFLNPPLTSIAQDQSGLIQKAVAMIIDMIEGKQPPSLYMTLPTQLMIRKSVRNLLTAEGN
jgi:DNA-binding LacI/PurR family transcriptional regulator